MMDEDDSKSLDAQEFAQAMRECNLLLSKQELTELFKFFDQDGGGSISYDEFLEGVRGPVSKRRDGLIVQAFQVIDKDNNGILEPAEVVEAYKAVEHPDVLSGKREQDDVRAEFLHTFDVGSEIEGMVTKEEFVNYYRNVSSR